MRHTSIYIIYTAVKSNEAIRWHKRYVRVQYSRMAPPYQIAVPTTTAFIVRAIVLILYLADGKMQTHR